MPFSTLQPDAGRHEPDKALYEEMEDRHAIRENTGHLPPHHADWRIPGETREDGRVEGFPAEDAIRQGGDVLQP